MTSLPTNFSRLLILFVTLCIAHITYSQTSPLSKVSSETGLLLNDQTTRTLIHESSGDRAHDHVKQIAMWDRSGQHYVDAANWVKSKAKEFGLAQVEIEIFPTEDDAWIVKRGILKATFPYEFCPCRWLLTAEVWTLLPSW